MWRHVVKYKCLSTNAFKCTDRNTFFSFCFSSLSFSLDSICFLNVSECVLCWVCAAVVLARIPMCPKKTNYSQWGIFTVKIRLLLFNIKGSLRSLHFSNFLHLAISTEIALRVSRTLGGSFYLHSWLLLLTEPQHTYTFRRTHTVSLSQSCSSPHLEEVESCCVFQAAL